MERADERSESFASLEARGDKEKRSLTLSQAICLMNFHQMVSKE